MACRSTSATPATLRLAGDLLSESVPIDSESPLLRRTVVVPPGRHAIRFTCDAPRFVSVVDTRPIVFRVMGFALQESTIATADAKGTRE